MPIPAQYPSVPPRLPGANVPDPSNRPPVWCTHGVVSFRGDVEPIDALSAMLALDHPLKKSAETWANEHLGCASSGTFDRIRWQAAADAGILGLMMPDRFGGTPSPAVNTMLIFEGLGRGASDNGLVFAFASQVIAMQRALLAFGSELQLQRYLPALVGGGAIGAFALTEAATGSDTGAITTLAEEQPDGSYRLTGAKAWATLAPVCDVIIVFATTNPSQGRWGLTAFLVEAGAPGVVLGPQIAKMGLAGCPVGSIELDSVRVGADAVLGRPGAGGAVFAHAVDAERAFLYASQLGATERVLDLSIERARTRTASGKNIGSFQAVAHRIVDLKLRHEAARLLLYKAAALYDRGASVTQAAALTKIQAAEQGVEAALDALRVFGADGYGVSTGVEVELRDALGGLFYSGTTDVARNIVAGSLRLDRARPSPADVAVDTLPAKERQRSS